MLLPVLGAVAQLIFDLLLRPMIVERVIQEASAAGIRLAAEHILIRGTDDRLRLVPRHGSIASAFVGPVCASLFAARAIISPVVGAIRAAFVAAPMVISLPDLVPAVVVMDLALTAFPVPWVVLAALIVRCHPIRA